MNKYKAFLRASATAVFLVLAASTAWAGQSAEWVCVQVDYEGNCVRYELRVLISSDADTGRPGAFGIGVRLGSGGMAYWTLADGFKAYNGGLLQPVEGMVAALPASRQYVVFAGSKDQLCAMVGQQAFDLYAGHGAIPVGKEEQLNFLLSKNMKLEVDHIRGAYVQMDAYQNPWKVGLVYSGQQCSNSGN